ncbi:sugar ABC transporter substrate-binding protein [Ferviditalea candida]|uniref:Sugar ABC transporter substrate-binding protein n=1 Tax=Ferviditalea candida TaxID=3108399 RepID=A0ABU5ZFV7_9BACL|nr:sugar ABC transporter substrate-binding protein [Paenibacillaceae bacterium T2]
MSLLAGCGASNSASPSNPANSPAGTSSAAPSTSESKRSSDIKIGSLHFSFTIPQVQAVIKAQDDKAKELGISTVQLDGQGDAQKQTQQLNNLLVQKVDAVLIEPVDPKGVIPMLKKFHDAGIPVIDSILPVDEEGMQYVTTFIGVDNVQDGNNAAKLMKEALPGGGTVVIIEGAPGTTSAVERTKGFEEGLKDSNIKIVGKQASPWDRTQALHIMQDFLVKYPDLSGVFVHSDDMAMGALQAIKSAGKLGQIKVIGHDGSKEAVQAIQDGSMYGSVVELLVWEGQKGVEVAKDIAEGKPVEKRYIHEPFLLTKKNLADYQAAF